MGLGFSVSREMIEDGKFDLVADMTRKLARSAKESQEIDAMSIFNNGFSTETTADGLAIFHAAHTLPSGLTYRNLLSSTSDLSSTSLETALQDFETQFIGDSGIIYNYAPKILLVHPSNKRYARELVGSDLKADTADNNMNSFKNEGLMVMSSPHLTDADAWFLVGDKSDNGLRIINRKPIATDSDMVNGWSTDSIRYKVSYREKIGCLHAQAIFGTAGV
jgi:phage major head subunit gpT-like protein